MWAGEWQRQWAGIWRRYEDIAGYCERRILIVFCSSSHNLDFIYRLPVDEALVLEDSYYDPENLLAELEQAEERNALYLFGYGDYSHEMAVRLSCRLGGSSLTAVKRLSVSEGRIYADKNVYSNNMEGTFLCRSMPFCVSITKEGDTAKWNGDFHDLTVSRRTVSDAGSYVFHYEEEEMAADSSLEDSKIIIALGKGVRKRTDYLDAKELADMLGAKIVASRPLVMQGIAPLDCLTGASGVITHPRLCIAAGVSGAAAFYVGIEKSGYIIAINTDPEAFIMTRADVVIEEDLRGVFKALKDYLKEKGEQHDLRDGCRI